MTETEELAILNQAFVRVYRSFGQYLREAAPVFDVGEETIQAILDRQADDVERLGEYLVQEQGHVFPGAFPMEYSDLHFLKSSRLLQDWTAFQERHVQSLEGDLSRLEGSGSEGALLLTEIVKHEKEHLDRLRELSALPVPMAT